MRGRALLADVVSQVVEATEYPNESQLAVLVGQHYEVEPLLTVVRLLRAVLVPVEPSPAFTAALKARLMTAHLEDLPPSPSPYARRLVLGSIAFGSLVSAAAVYFLLTRSRPARAA